MKVIECKDEAQWLNERSKLLTASDIASIFGANPFKSELALWAEKTGAIEPSDLSESEPVQWGKEFQGAIGRRFAAKTGREVREAERFNIYIHPDVEFLGATLDFWEKDKEKGEGILEAKATDLQWEENAPLAYQIQVQCMMGPDYKRPETPQAESWRVSPSTSESMANLPWWELLKDETLQQLIRTALILENLDLQIATANIDQFQAQLTIAKFDLVLSFSYEGSAFGFRNTNTSNFPVGGGAVPTSEKNGLSLHKENIGVGLKWELDIWGRIRRSIEAARAQLLSKQENQRVVILSLVSGPCRGELL